MVFLIMTKQDKEFKILWNEARIAGLQAGAASTPIPMVVAQHSNVADDRSPVTQAFFVEGGVCGFATIRVRPANSAFANWLKKNNLGRTSQYSGGVSVHVHDFGQSLTRKEAYAYAFAEVLCKAGITASAESRID